MDPSWLALVAFLAVTVVAAGVFLWPRFRESVAVEDPVVPDVVLRLQAALHDASAEAPDTALYRDLSRALEHDPRQVRRDKATWQHRLRELGCADAIVADLDKL